MNYSEWIKAGLQKPGKTQRGLAKALSIDPAAVNRLLKGERQIKLHEMPIISAYIEEPPLNYTASNARETISDKKVATKNQSTLTFVKGERTTSERPRDLPILGHAKAGEMGVFIDNGTIGGYAVRPDSLAGVPDAYAVYVNDTSMFPAFKHGKLAYVNPIRPVQPGDDVVIQLSDGQALIKTFVKRTKKVFFFKQYSPAKELEFPADDVTQIHFIATTDR